MKQINFYQKKYEALETFYGLDDDEIMVFNEEIEEVEALL